MGAETVVVVWVETGDVVWGGEREGGYEWV